MVEHSKIETGPSQYGVKDRTKVFKPQRVHLLWCQFDLTQSLPSPISFDEFYDKLKDIVNFTFNLGATIPKPKVVRKVLRFLPERFHAKITTIKESKDIDKIPLTELGLSRIGKSSKSKSMALKAKSSDTDESSDDVDSKMKFYITR